MNKEQLIVFARSECGKRFNKVSRRKGMIPAVIYNKDYHKLIYLLAKDLRKDNQYDQPLQLVLGSEVLNVVYRSVQKHPISEKILHIDFLKSQDV